MWLAFRIFAAIAVALSVAGCGQTTPPLSHVMNNFPVSDYIPVSEVVDRVKCDLARGFDSRIKGEDANDAVVAQYQWLQNWTAEVDLTLEVNESGSLTPTAAYVLPLKNAFNYGTGPSTSTGTAIAATSRNFTFGFGGTYTGQAARTELLSFALSLKELKYWYHHGGSAHCDRPDGLDLEGRIDLTTWVDEALRPVDADALTSGNHLAPTTQKGAQVPQLQKPEAGPAIAKMTSDQQKSREEMYLRRLIGAVREQMQARACVGCQSALEGYSESGPGSDPTFYASGTPDALKQAVDAVKQTDDLKSQADASAAQARRSAVAVTTTIAMLKNVERSLDPTFLQKVESNLPSAQTAATNAKNWADSADALQDCAAKATGYAKEREDDAAEVMEFSYYATICAKLAVAVTKQAAGQANKAASNAGAAKKTPNPPIESLSQTLQFVLTLGLTASPSWTLVYWKGPALNGNLLNLNGIRTHTLDIALGPPGPGGSKTGLAQQSAIANLGLIKVQNAINTLTLPQ